MTAEDIHEPRFLDVFSYSIYRLLEYLRRSGAAVTASVLTLISIILVFGLVAETRFRPKELPPMYSSIGISIGHSPFDAKFHRAAVPGGGALWISIVTQARRFATPMQRIEFVHRFVTSNIAYIDDARLYRADDYWATPSQTLDRVPTLGVGSLA